jgi:hypothetical protein
MEFGGWFLRKLCPPRLSTPTDRYTKLIKVTEI